jgi:hypothetical protein
MYCRYVKPSLLVILAVAGASVPTATASKPIKRTLDGCVVDGTFYSVSDAHAYRISPGNVDLKPLEGKAVSMTGWLSPGDRFELEKGASPTVVAATCPADKLRPIHREKVVRLRVDASYAADAGDLAGAEKKMAAAIALMTPPDCDTLTDRAHLMAKKGDLAAAGKDIAAIKAKKACVVDKPTMNPLLLKDLGKTLVGKGDKKLAVQAFEIALANCDGDWCRPDISKELEAAKK